MINLSRLHYPVTALGPGRRAGVWMQGCRFGCAGCLSRDTWDEADGIPRDVDAVTRWIADLCDAPGDLDGVTISGGEPTDQPEALRELMFGISILRRDGVFDGDVLCYTGCEYDEFLSRCPWAPGRIDAVITGLFRAEQPTTLVWRGSANQQLIALTSRGQRLYAAHVDRKTITPQIQLAVADGQIWMIGIPRRGDLQRIESSLRSDGVLLEGVSWRQR